MIQAMSCHLPWNYTIRFKSNIRRSFLTWKFSLARNHDSVLNYWDKIGTPSDTHRWCSVMKTAPLYRITFWLLIKI